MNTVNDPWQQYADRDDHHGDENVGSESSTHQPSVSGTESSSELLRHLATGPSDPYETTVPARRGRAVAWIRPSDLMRHGTARLAARGIGRGTTLSRPAHDWAAGRLAPLGDRGQDATAALKSTVARLAPLSAFGAGKPTGESMSQEGLGR